MIQTETNRDSCLRTLLWRRTTCIATLSIGCYRIANDWKASNLGFGRWLITAADDHYELIEPDEINTNQPNTVTKAGCRVFFITLGCGRVITGPNIKLRSDQARPSQTKRKPWQWWKSCTKREYPRLSSQGGSRREIPVIFKCLSQHWARKQWPLGGSGQLQQDQH